MKGRFVPIGAEPIVAQRGRRFGKTNLLAFEGDMAWGGPEVPGSGRPLTATEVDSIHVDELATG